MMDTYCSIAIGSIAKARGGKRLPPNMGVQDDETDHPYLRVVDFGDDGVDRSNLKFISNETYEYVKRYTISSDDVYVSIAGTIGRVGIVPEDLSGSNLTENAAKITEISNQVDKRYLLYFLRSAQGQGELQNKSGGTSQPKLALFRIEEIEFPCPPIGSQRAIADIISTYDDLIENNRRRMALLEDSARLIYREWFVRLRFPGYEHISIVDGVPQGWERKTLGELSSFLKRGITPRYDDDAEGLVINQKCIRDGRVNLELARSQSKEVKPERILQIGDVLVNSTGEGTLGRVAQVKVSLVNCTVDTHVSIVRPNQDIGRHYFGQAMMDWEPRFSNMGKGATNQTELSPAAIGETAILVPSHTLLEQFEAFAEPLYEQVSNLIAQNQKLRAARDMLLPRLMNGELKV